MALTPEQLQEIRNQVTKMVNNGRSDAEIQAWKDNYLKSVKTAPPVDQTGTPVEVQTPEGGDFVSEDTSSESLDPDKQQTYGEQASSWLDRRLGREEDEEDYIKGPLGAIINSVPYFGDLIDDGARAYGTGRAQARIVDDALKLFSQGEEIDPEVLEEYYKRAQELQNQPVSSEMKAFNNIYESEGGGVWGFLKAAATEPQAAGETIISSLVAMINPSSALGAGLGAGTGAAVGTAFTPIGTGIGAIGGATGGASAVLDTALSFNEFLQEELAEKGLDFTEDGIKELWKDKDAINRIRARSAGRGATIGIIDALTAGVAGKIGKGVAKTAGKAYAGTAAAFATEAAGGGVGEAAARVVAGQELDAREIGLEILGEFGQAVPVVRQINKEIKTQDGATINGQPVTLNEVKSTLTKPTAENQYSDIKVNNPDLQKEINVNKYSVDPEENANFITPDEKQERNAIIQKIDELGPLWQKARKAGEDSKMKFYDKKLNEYRGQLQDVMAKQGERISYLNPEQQNQFKNALRKTEKLGDTIKGLEEDGAPQGLIEETKAELDEANQQVSELYDLSQSEVQAAQLRKDQANQKRQATKEKNEQIAAEEAGVVEEEVVEPDPIQEQRTAIQEEIVNEDIKTGDSEAQSIDDFMEGLGAVDNSKYKKKPITNIESFAPIGKLGENLSEGDFSKVYDGIFETEPEYGQAKAKIEKFAIQNGLQTNYLTDKVDSEGRPVLKVEFKKPRKEPLSDQVNSQLESAQQAQTEEGLTEDEAEFEGYEGERTPQQAAIDYAVSEAKDQGGRAYEGAQPIETEDGGVLYPDIKKYSPQVTKEAGVHATVKKMEQAGFEWEGQPFTVTEEGLKINPPSGRKDTGVELNLGYKSTRTAPEVKKELDAARREAFGKPYKPAEVTALERELRSIELRSKRTEGGAKAPEAISGNIGATKVHNDIRGVEGETVKMNIGLENNPYSYDDMVKLLKNNKDLTLGTTQRVVGEFEGKPENTLVLEGKYRGSEESFKKYMQKLTDRTTQQFVPSTFGDKGLMNKGKVNVPGYDLEFDPQYFKEPVSFEQKALDARAKTKVSDLKTETGTAEDRAGDLYKGKLEPWRHETESALDRRPVTIPSYIDKGPGLRTKVDNASKSPVIQDIAEHYGSVPNIDVVARKTGDIIQKKESLLGDFPTGVKELTSFVKDFVDRYNNLLIDVNMAKDLKRGDETSPEHQKLIDTFKKYRPVAAAIKAYNSDRSNKGKFEDALDAVQNVDKKDFRNNTRRSEIASTDKTPSPLSGPPAADQYAVGEVPVDTKSSKVGRRQFEYRLMKAFQNDITRAVKAVNDRSNVPEVEGKTLNEETIERYNNDNLGFENASSKEVLARNLMRWARGVAAARGNLTPDVIGAANLGVAEVIAANDSFENVADMMSKVKNGIVKEIASLRRNKHGDVLSTKAQSMANKVRKATTDILKERDVARQEGKLVIGSLDTPEGPVETRTRVKKALPYIEDTSKSKDLSNEQIAEKVFLNDNPGESLPNRTSDKWKNLLKNVTEARNRSFSHATTNLESALTAADADYAFFESVPAEVIESAATGDGLGSAILGDNRFNEIVNEVQGLLDQFGGIIPDREGVHRRYDQHGLPVSPRGKKLSVDKKVDKLIKAHNKNLGDAIRKIVSSHLNSSNIRNKKNLISALSDAPEDILDTYVFGKSRDLKDPNNFAKFQKKLFQFIAAEAEAVAVINNNPALAESLTAEKHIARGRAEGKKRIPAKKGRKADVKPIPEPEGTPWAEKRQSLIDAYEQGKTIPSNQLELNLESGDLTRNLDTPGNVKPTFQVNTKGENSLNKVQQHINDLESIITDPDFDGWVGLVTGSFDDAAKAKGRRITSKSHEQGYIAQKAKELAELYDLKFRQNTKGAKGFFHIYEPGTPPDHIEANITERDTKTQAPDTDFTNAVESALKKAWPDIKISFNPSDFVGAVNERLLRGLRIPMMTKGFFDPGTNEVFVNSTATYETGIHELAHVWAQKLLRENPELWKRGRNLLKGSDYAKAIYNIPHYRAYLKEQPARFWEEVMASAIGQRGAVLFNDKKKAGVWDKWMDKVGSWLKDKLGISSKKDYKDLTLDDWLNTGVHGVFSGSIPPAASSKTYGPVELNVDPDADPDVAAAKIAGEKVDWHKVKIPFTEGHVKIPKRILNLIVPPAADDYHGLVSKIGDLVKPNLIKEVTDAFNKAHVNYVGAATKVRENISAAEKKLKDAGININKSNVATINGQSVSGAQAIQAAVDGYANDFASKPAVAEYMKTLQDMGVLKPSTGKRTYASASPSYDKVNYIVNELYAEHFSDFNKAKDSVFTPKVMANIRAKKGNLYADALQNSLQRMSSGKNSAGISDTTLNKWNSWLLGSVGNIMFLNFRSAALQTLSIGNFGFESKQPGKFFAKLFDPATFAKAKKLYNDPYLKERRARAGFDVNAEEMMTMLEQSNSFGEFTKKVLNFGFAATSFVDSVAIAFGGAAFIEAGGTRAQWIKASEEAQQSSRPDRVSQWQSSGVAKYILAFANTPQQYFRLSQKAFREIREGKNIKGNLAKIGYYMAVQNAVFTMAQSASMALLGIDDDEEEALNQYNSMTGTILRGMGLYGAVIDAVKNVALRGYQEEQKANPDHVATMLKATSISPPLSRKIQELQAIGRAHNYDQENKWTTTGAKGIAVATNLPTDWAQKKGAAVMNLWNEQYNTIQKILMLAGWSEWNFKDNENDWALEDLDLEELDLEELELEELEF